MKGIGHVSANLYILMCNLTDHRSQNTEKTKIEIFRGIVKVS